MPRVPESFLGSVFYLYRSVGDAERGEKNGGTGFFVSVVDDDPQAHPFLYAVSNWHIVAPDVANAPVARVNTKAGGIEVLDGLVWKHHPAGDDVAIAHVGLAPEHFAYRAIKSSLCLTGWQPGDVDESGARVFGPGNDTFFIGRYADHEGREQNHPVVRFGNVSMMPWEKIRNPYLQFDQESYVVESRSLGGFSGSPVFVNPQYFLSDDGRMDFYMSGASWLLGLVWGHGELFGPVYESDEETEVDGRWVVKQNNGLMYVVPSWKIRDLLMDDEEIARRAKRRDAWSDEGDTEIGQMRIVFRGGPNDGQTDSYERAPDAIGANERVGEEIQAANGAYVPTNERDDDGRAVYVWRPLTDDEIETVLGGGPRGRG